MSVTTYIGSPLAPRPEVYRATVGILCAELQELGLPSRVRTPFADLVERFNQRSKRRAAIFAMLTADRGTCFERRTVAALLGHPDIAMIAGMQWPFEWA